jgi:nucleoid-associated protein YgaU
MSAYYKKIDGKNYDRAMLEKAENSVKGRGDGRISLADARNLIKLIKDGGRITEIEKRTLSYILENFTFTDTAIKYVEKALSESLPVQEISETGSSFDSIKEKQTAKDYSTQKTIKKPVIIIGIFILLILLVFVVIKNRYKNKKIENQVIEKTGEMGNNQKNEPAVQQTKVPEVIPDTDKVKQTDIKQKAERPKSNEYIVKENDNLIKISIEIYDDYKMWIDIYRLNKDNMNRPSLIYPGQVLKLPDKKSK